MMQPTTGSGNVPRPPTVQQPPMTVPQRIMLNKSYLVSITGILRIALIVITYFILSLLHSYSSASTSLYYTDIRSRNYANYNVFIN